MIRVMADAAQEVIRVLGNCRRVMLTTHVRPDGDALGCCAAMAMALRLRGIASNLVLLSPPPRRYAFILQENAIDFLNTEQAGMDQLCLDSFDALLVLDTGTASQLPGLMERIRSWAGAKLVVDHHLTQEDWADVLLVEPDASATGEIVAGLLDVWGIPIDGAIASALYLALVTDTGWFQFANTRSQTLRLAARLMDCGADPERMYRAVYQNETKQRLALMTRVQDSLQLLLDDRLAVMELRSSDFQQTGAEYADTENLINIPLQIATVEVSILAVEPPEGGPIRISLRSKGQVDVSRFAEQFGGGGHFRAAGLTLDAPFEEARARVVQAMIERMRPLGGL